MKKELILGLSIAIFGASSANSQDPNLRRTYNRNPCSLESKEDINSLNDYEIREIADCVAGSFGDAEMVDGVRVPKIPLDRGHAYLLYGGGFGERMGMMFHCKQGFGVDYLLYLDGLNEIDGKIDYLIDLGTDYRQAYDIAHEILASKIDDRGIKEIGGLDRSMIGGVRGIENRWNFYLGLAKIRCGL